MIRAVIAAAALLSSAATAATPAEENARDARCLIIAFELAENKDKEIETAGLLTSQYYLGRIDGRTPGVDLAALIVKEVDSVNDKTRPQLIASCSKQVEDRNKQLETMGERLAAGG